MGPDSLERHALYIDTKNFVSLEVFLFYNSQSFSEIRNFTQFSSLREMLNSLKYYIKKLCKGQRVYVHMNRRPSIVFQRVNKIGKKPNKYYVRMCIAMLHDLFGITFSVWYTKFNCQILSLSLSLAGGN